jgi:dipeptidyl-peptidase-4
LRTNLRTTSLLLLSSLSVAMPCLATAPAASSAPASTPWTVHDLYYPASGAMPVPAETEWSPDGSLLSYRLPDGSLGAIAARTGHRSVLTPGNKLTGIAARPVDEKNRDHRKRYAQKGYFWSPDGAQILFDEDGTLWLDTLKAGTIRKIGDTGQGSGDDVQFSPDGHLVSYLHDHNLYALRLNSGSTQPAQPIALTHTTDPNLLNGEVDWVYLEELKVRTNYSWSPDSKQIAYVQMDETKVPTYPITDWIPTHATIDEQKYPQAGDPNPSVRVGIVSADGGATRFLALPDVRPNQDYIPRSGWLNDRTVWVETLNRDHRHMTIWFADSATGTVTKALTITDPKFFDENYDLDFFAPGQMLLRSWRTGYMHIDRYTYTVPASAQASVTAPLKLQGELEHGAYDVSDILAVVPSATATATATDGAAQSTVYYLGNEGSLVGAQLWAVQLDGKNKRQISTIPGTHKVEFADGHADYTDNFSSLATPPQLEICSIGAACSSIWKGSAPVGHTVRAPQLLTLKAADGKTLLSASLLLPEGNTDAASVPLINNPYGGPGVSTVHDAWGGDSLYFDDLLAEHGFAVLHVDNRGMGDRGRAYEQAAYRDFGKVQLADQLAAIDQVLARYPQLDAQRLGWWGWSWGGTFTLNALTHSTRFRAGISVAPVTDFRNYDSIYTERYLGLPQAEASVYDEAAVQKTAASLHGHLLIAHGTGDDNVHIANTVQFIQQLIDHNRPYDLQIFPRKTHSIAGKEARTELFEHMLNHWELYLLPKDDVSTIR